MTKEERHAKLTIIEIFNHFSMIFKALLHFHISSAQDASIVSSGASLVVQMVKNPSAMQETQVQSLGQEDPLEKESLPTSIFLPENSVDRVLELSNSLPGSSAGKESICNAGDPASVPGSGRSP